MSKKKLARACPVSSTISAAVVRWWCGALWCGVGGHRCSKGRSGLRVEEVGRSRAQRSFFSFLSLYTTIPSSISPLSLSLNQSIINQSINPSTHPLLSTICLSLSLSRHFLLSKRPSLTQGVPSRGHPERRYNQSIHPSITIYYLSISLSLSRHFLLSKRPSLTQGVPSRGHPERRYTSCAAASTRRLSLSSELNRSTWSCCFNTDGGKKG